MSDELVKRLRSQIGDDVTAIYDREALFSQAADRIEELEAALDSHHAEVGHNIWRFWSQKARETASRNKALEAENARLADVLTAIEIMTATGDGLSPDETIRVHILAAEGRAT